MNAEALGWFWKSASSRVSEEGREACLCVPVGLGGAGSPEECLGNL